MVLSAFTRQVTEVFAAKTRAAISNRTRTNARVILSSRASETLGLKTWKYDLILILLFLLLFLLLGRPLQKVGSARSVSNLNDVRQDTDQLTESDFRFDVSLLRWRLWRYFTHKSAATCWVHTQCLPRAYAAASASSCSVVHFYVCTCSLTGLYTPTKPKPDSSLSYNFNLLNHKKFHNILRSTAVRPHHLGALNHVHLTWAGKT